MDRRQALHGIGSSALVGLAGCTSIQGVILGKVPKKFEIQNKTSSSITVDIQIEADNKIVLDESYRIPANDSIDKPWPQAEATTYTIAAIALNDESAFTFDPSDWKQRHTPIVLITENGVEVFVED
jgi:hypothetical protein